MPAKSAAQQKAAGAALDTMRKSLGAETASTNDLTLETWIARSGA